MPQTGDLLMASYRYANPSNPLGSLTSPQVICSSVGASTSATTLTQLGSCTIPAGLLGTGDRIEMQFQYAHTGNVDGIHGSRSTVGGATYLIADRGGGGDGIRRADHLRDRIGGADLGHAKLGK